MQRRSKRVRSLASEKEVADKRGPTRKKYPIVDVDRCTKVLSNPESWVVERTAENTEDVWLQLWDGRVATTSKAISACADHRVLRDNECLCGIRISFTETHDLNELMCSFIGGKVVMGFYDNAQSQVLVLLDVLKLVTGQNGASRATTRQGRALPSARTRPPARGVQLQSPLFRRHLGQSAAKRRRIEVRSFAISRVHLHGTSLK